MKNNQNKLWGVVIALGWIFDFLFWNKTPGVNFAIFSALCVAAAFALLLSDGVRPHRATLILLPLFGLFASVTFLRAEPMTIILSVVFTMFTMLIIAITYQGGRWFQYTIADYFAKSFALLGSVIGRPITFSVEARKAQVESGVQPTAKYNLWPIVRGIVIAVPIIAIFASLLASADVVFGQRLGDFVDLFRLEKLPEYIFRFVYILVIGYALAGIVLHAASESKDEKLTGEEKPMIPAFLGFIESSIVLGSVVVLFASFVVIQFQYFFGGHANINVEGFTYSQYARRGFGELVAVAFFALMMLLTLTAVTRRETETQRKVYSGLGIALVALLLVMLVSAYQRLGLYEAAYGFSRLRTYTHVFLVWIGILLVTTIVLEILRKERMFTFAMLIASFGFAISLPILNVDAFIVNQNIQRELNGTSVLDDTTDRVELDAQYFTSLSDDAIPPLVSAFKDKSMPADVHEKIGAMLDCIQHNRSKTDSSWQSFHVSRAKADAAFASIEKPLSEYEIIDQDWPLRAVTPSGNEFNCTPDYYSD